MGHFRLNELVNFYLVWLYIYCKHSLSGTWTDLDDPRPGAGRLMCRRQTTPWGQPSLCLCCKCSRLHLQKGVQWMRADIFLSVSLTFVSVYNVELISLWVFQVSSICFLLLSCLVLCVTGFCVRATASLRPCCSQYFGSVPGPQPFLISQNVEIGHILCWSAVSFEIPFNSADPGAKQEKKQSFLSGGNCCPPLLRLESGAVKVTLSTGRLTLSLSLCVQAAS